MSISPESQLSDPVFDKFAEDSEDRSSGPTSTTPNSEISPPDSPRTKDAGLSQSEDARASSRKLAATLTLEEQVGISAP